MMLTLGRIVAAVLSGLLLAQAYGLTPFWPLAWIAPVPLLIAIIGATRLGALLYSALAGALSMALMFPYLTELGGPVVPAILTLIKALIWGGMSFAVRGAARHLPLPAAVFVFPALMAGIETLIAASSPHGSAGSLAYSQMDFLPAIQVASLGGAPAITFVLALFASLLSFLIAKRAIFSAIAPVLILAAAIGWGFMRPIETTQPGSRSPLHLALLAGDNLDFEAADWRSTWETYVHRTANAADAGARIIVLPEKIVVLPDADVEEALAPLMAIAAQHDAAIVVGVTQRVGERSFNRAYLVGARGLLHYDKQHMIPGLEADLTPGRETGITERDGLRIGVAICKDMDFPQTLRRYAGVQIMFVPAWDFTTDAWLHSRMAVLRGVENGFTIVRSAREGVMTVSNPYGRVVAEAASGGDIATLTSEIPTPAQIPTLYAVIGDALGWLCAALAALLIGWTILASRRAGQGS